MDNVWLAFCTFPDAATARQIGMALVEKQLAACVNLIPALESIYHWQGRVESSNEVLAIFKTRADLWPEFEATLADLHPYEVPEIVAIEPQAVTANYAAWVHQSTRPF